MTPNEVNEAIKASALAIIPNVVYLRATDQEANISADGLDLQDKVFCLYNNKPDIGAVVSQESGLVLESYPVEISLLCLADMDDNDMDMDVLVEPLYGFATKMFDNLSAMDQLAEYPDTYNIQLGDDSTKIYDKVMSGVVLTFDLMGQRGVSCLNPIERLPNPNQPQPPPNAGENPNQPQPPPNAGENPNQPQPPPNAGENPNQPQPVPVPPATESITYAMTTDQGFASLVFPAGLGQPWNHILETWAQLNIGQVAAGNFDILSKDLVSDFPITGLYAKAKLTVFFENLGGMLGNSYIQLCNGTTPIVSKRINATQQPPIAAITIEIETDYTVFNSNIFGVNIFTAGRAISAQRHWNIDKLVITRANGTPSARPPINISWGGLDEPMEEWSNGGGVGVNWLLQVSSWRLVSDGTTSDELKRLATWQVPQSLTTITIQGQYRTSIASDLGDQVAELYVDGALIESIDMPAYIGTGNASWNIGFAQVNLINSGNPFVGFRIRDVVPRAGLILDMNAINVAVA